MNIQQYPDYQRWLNASFRADQGMAFVLCIVFIGFGLYATWRAERGKSFAWTVGALSFLACTLVIIGVMAR